MIKANHFNPIVPLFLIPVIGLALFGVTQAFAGPKNGTDAPRGNPCEGALLSKKIMEIASVTLSQVNEWAKAPRMAPLVSGASALEKALRDAPAEALETLSVLAHTRLADERSERALVKHLVKLPVVQDMERILGRRIEEFASVLTNLYLADRFLGVDSRNWLRPVLSSPVAAILLAHAMNSFQMSFIEEMPQIGKDTKRDEWWSLRTAVRSRTHGSGDIVLWPFVSTSPELARSMAVHLLTLNQKNRDSQGVHDIESLKKWQSHPEREKMVEWVVGRLTGKSTVPPESPKWLSYYKTVAELAKTPISKWRRINFGFVLGTNGRDPRYNLLTIGNLALTDIVSEAVFTSISYARRNGVPLARSRADDFSDVLRFLLLDMPRHGAFSHEQAAILARFALIIVGFDFPSAGDVRRRFKDELTLAISEFGEFKRMNDNVPNSRQDQVVNLQDMGLSLAGTNPIDYLESLVTTSSPEMANQEPSDLLPFIKGERGATDLRANTLYVVEFKRRNSKFFGMQWISFSERAIKDMIGYQTKEIHPVSWLSAIQMGIAAEFGERGLKIFGSEKDSLLFEVKLLLTPYRLMGRWSQGVWRIDSMEDPH